MHNDTEYGSFQISIRKLGSKVPEPQFLYSMPVAKNTETLVREKHRCLPRLLTCLGRAKWWPIPISLFLPPSTPPPLLHTYKEGGGEAHRNQVERDSSYQTASLAMNLGPLPIAHRCEPSQCLAWSCVPSPSANQDTALATRSCKAPLAEVSHDVDDDDDLFLLHSPGSASTVAVLRVGLS